MKAVDRRSPKMLLMLVLLLLAAVTAAMVIGAARIPAADIVHALWGKGDAFTRNIIMDVRLPRVLAAVLAGASLGLSGPVLQAMYANPLVDPGLIVIGPGAAIGAAVASALAPGSVWFPAVAASATAATAALLLGRISVTGAAFALIGVAGGTAAMSLLGILTSVPRVAAGRPVLSWVFGSLAQADWRVVTVTAIALFAGASLLVGQARNLDAAALGPAEAELLGVDLRRANVRWSVASATLVGTLIASFGVVAFIALAAPQILKAVGVRLHAPLLVCSAMAGATLLVIADTLARSTISATEVPVGFFAAAIGAPLLIGMLRYGVRHG